MVFDSLDPELEEEVVYGQHGWAWKNILAKLLLSTPNFEILDDESIEALEEYRTFSAWARLIYSRKWYIVCEQIQEYPKHLHALFFERLLDSDQWSVLFEKWDKSTAHISRFYWLTLDHYRSASKQGFDIELSREGLSLLLW